MNFDEKTVNADWAQDCEINFFEAINQGDYVQAKACIGDMRDIFPQWADRMEEDLRNSKHALFTHPSNIYAI